MRTDFASLRADLIGTDAVITTPFGKRRVTYADDVASGQALRSVEDRVASLALPLYANTHTEDSATGAHSTHLTHQAAEYVKGQLGGDEPCKLVFCGSGSAAARAAHAGHPGAERVFHAPGQCPCVLARPGAAGGVRGAVRAP